jgi:hypothetical protein
MESPGSDQVNIAKDSSQFLGAIKAGLGDPYDLQAETRLNGKVTAVYLHAAAGRQEVRDHLLAALSSPGLAANAAGISWDDLLPVIAEQGRRQRTSLAEALQDLVSGRVVLHLDGSDRIVSYDAQAAAKRQPTDAQAERSIRAPRITFIENLDANLSIIREGIKDVKMRVDWAVVGRRTRTDIAVVYLSDVADPRIVAEVHHRLQTIDIDGIIDSGYIDQLITDNRWSLFPLIQDTERPDKVKAAILEGRVALLVNGSTQALIVPTTINELYQSPDDYLYNFWVGSFLRFFRILGNNIAVALPGLYIALIGVNNSLLPMQFTMSIAGSRMNVAAPLVIEILLMDVIVEVFREASLRLPSSVSQTLGVTTGIVLGTASVQAGIVSSATLVVVVIAAIASFSGPNFGIGFTWRILKFVLIIVATMFGLYGLTIAGLIILGHAAMQNSFGIPLLSPWSPVRFKSLIDTVLRRPLWSRTRLQIYRPIDSGRFRSKRKRNDDEK